MMGFDDTVRFAEPPEGTIAKICGNCLRVGVPLVWDEERWGYCCVDPRECYEYLCSRRRPLDFWDTDRGQWILIAIAAGILVIGIVWGSR